MTIVEAVPNYIQFPMYAYDSYLLLEPKLPYLKRRMQKALSPIRVWMNSQLSDLLVQKLTPFCYI